MVLVLHEFPVLEGLKTQHLLSQAAKNLNQKFELEPKTGYQTGKHFLYI
jgi:hypothetical protein